MSKINFNYKSAGSFITASDINTIKDAVNDNESFIGNTNVSGYFDASNQFRYNYHIIPEDNSLYDLGSAENKIRHLFLSDNSLWVGDKHKITIDSDGLKTKARNTKKLPYYIDTVLNGNENDAIAHAGVSSLEEITLDQLIDYAKSLDPTANIDKIFPSDATSDYKDVDYKNIVDLEGGNTKSAPVIQIVQDEDVNLPIFNKKEFIANVNSLTSISLNIVSPETIVDNNIISINLYLINAGSITSSGLSLKVNEETVTIKNAAFVNSNLGQNAEQFITLKLVRLQSDWSCFVDILN